MKNTEIIRVFLSSPSDVLHERQRVVEISNELNKSLGFTLGRHIEIIGWENISPSISSYAQQVINMELDNYDIFLGIFALRFGTPTPKAGSGTEEEFNIALAKYKRNEIKDICMFFKQDGFDIGEINIDQLKAVKDFQNKISAIGCYRVNFKIQNFDEEIRKLFSKLIVQWDVIKQRNVEQEANEIVEFEDEEVGYYDAIYKALDELNENEEISLKINFLMKNLNSSMHELKDELEECVDDKLRMNKINKFSDNAISIASNLKLNIIKEKELLTKSLKSFDIAAEILSQDFSNGSQHLISVVPALNNYKKMYENRIISNQKLMLFIGKFPRATTKLNGAKKKLLISLDEIKNCSEHLISSFDESLNLVEKIING